MRKLWSLQWRKSPTKTYPWTSTVSKIEQTCPAAFTWNECSAKSRNESQAGDKNLLCFFCTEMRRQDLAVVRAMVWSEFLFWINSKHQMRILCPILQGSFNPPQIQQQQHPFPRGSVHLTEHCSHSPLFWIHHYGEASCFLFIIFQMKWQESFPRGKLTTPSYKLAGSACSTNTVEPPAGAAMPLKRSAWAARHRTTPSTQDVLRPG